MEIRESLPLLGSVSHCRGSAAIWNRIENGSESNRECRTHPLSGVLSQASILRVFLPYAIPLPQAGRGKKAKGEPPCPITHPSSLAHGSGTSTSRWQISSARSDFIAACLASRSCSGWVRPRRSFRLGVIIITSGSTPGKVSEGLLLPRIAPDSSTSRSCIRPALLSRTLYVA